MPTKNSDRKKMLYLMHVSWYWIKQRPHFLAIHLSEILDTEIVYPKSIRHFWSKKTAPKNCKGILQLPLSRFSFIEKMNARLYRRALKQKLKNSDVLWIGHPADYAIIADLVPSKTLLVYDCMDDLCEFPGNNSESAIQSIVALERNLLQRADHLIVSSQRLKEVLQKRYQTEKNIEIVNNAIDNSFLDEKPLVCSIDYPDKKNYCDLMYFGTISEWFDFPLLMNALEKFPNLRLILIGPKCTNIPEHERIVHLGTQAHSSLPAFMEQAEALIMPFVINDLILAVNPVKLYEYLISSKPVISCDYAEIRPFGKFVYSYNSEIQFIDLINQLVNHALTTPSKSERMQFLKANTWQGRVNSINELLMLDRKAN